MEARPNFLGIGMILLWLVVPARAETIQITAGALDWQAMPGTPVRITLAGDSFTFAGSTDPLAGIFTPWIQCGVPECTGGVTVDLRSLWSDNDLPGTATYKGVTYSQLGGLTSPNTLSAEWTGALEIPTGFTGGLLTAPFLFSGRFAFGENLMQPPQRLDLAGSGLASLTFTPWPGQPGAFSLAAARYEFGAAQEGPAPTPEPASMLLIGTGLAGLAAFRRRRGAREISN
jgi:hypothetical protein